MRRAPFSATHGAASWPKPITIDEGGDVKHSVVLLLQRTRRPWSAWHNIYPEDMPRPPGDRRQAVVPFYQMAKRVSSRGGGRSVIPGGARQTRRRSVLPSVHHERGASSNGSDGDPCPGANEAPGEGPISPSTSCVARLLRADSSRSARFLKTTS